MKRNLLFGLGLSLALLLISSTASYISITNLITSSRMVRESHQTIDNLNSFLSIVKDAETGQRGFILTGDPSFLTPYNEAKEKIAENFNTLMPEIGNSALQKENLERLRLDIEKRMEVLDENLKSKKINGTVSNVDLLKGKTYMDDVRSVIDSMQNEERRLLDVRTASLKSLASITPSLIILAALLAFGITLFFYRKVSFDFNEKVRLEDELKMKNERSAKRIDAIEKLVSQISEGDYNIKLDDETKDNLGGLAGSLNSMADSLQNSFTLLEEKEWLQSAIALVNDTIVGEKDPAALASDILENIIDRTESKVAALYILEEDKLLHLAGSYSLAENEKKPVLKIGESIPGQCFLSGRQILLKDIPANEATISYAAGKTKPRNVVALPLARNKIAIGVLELGALHDYTPLQLEFLKSITANIGLAFYGVQNRKRLQELLVETQAQTEELQMQHSELESINAELEAQTQKVQASEEELRVQQEELMQTNQELEERTSMLEEKNKLIEERNTDIQQKSKELEQSTKYKSEFLANMSHELRTPLNSILLLSRLMADSKELDKQYVEYAEVMQSSGQGLLSLIDEILDLSKIEAGKMTLEIANVSLQEIVSEMNALFLPVAKNKNLEFKVNIEGSIETLLTDKMRLEQILKNLLSNAMKFTSTGYVSMNISGDAAGEKVIFKVADTGIGISKDKQKLVFEAFQQADGSTRRKFGGTGLGLSISRELSILLGGEIELKSNEGVGSEFILSLPANINNALNTPLKIENEKITPQHEVTIVEQQKRFIVDHIPNKIEDDRNHISKDDKVILIIEDDTSFAKILLDFSRQKNYKGIVAVQGDKGIELANHFKPRAILLDIQLPVMDGWQVMEALKSNPETRPIPVHIMSSLKLKKESLLSGAVDFIDKPFALEQMQEIFKKLEEVLSRSPKKVLIVEENKQHAQALTYFLGANNITTQIANNISESIETLKRHEIDCVVLDMGVPNKIAYETLETIKEIKGLENLPIIVFTGKNLSAGEETRIKKYADSIIVKTAYSYQRVLDEAGLFLHLVEEKNKKNQSIDFYEKISELRNVIKGKTVLIADDDVRNIFSLTKALETHLMNVLTATNGKEALDILKGNNKVDVILMDMMMPEMDGYESIREIRKMEKYKRTPVLAITAKAMMGDREKCIAAGASDYISKPVDIDQLISLLRVWLYDRL